MEKESKEKLKIVILIASLLVVGFILGIEIFYSVNKINNRKVTYTKTGDINYVTYLKNNEHFSGSFVEEKYNLVSSLVDYFNVDYNYSYVLCEKINYKLDYEVVGVLEVFDSDNNSKPIETKTYQLYDKKSTEGNGQVIKAEIFNNKIDYATYNKIVQGWKKEISPDAKLTVTYKVNWKGFSKTLNKEISDSYKSSFVIPVSEKTINIEKPDKVNETGTIDTDKPLNNGLLIVIIFTVVLFAILGISLILSIINHKNHSSKYEAKINKLLREFDRAITEVKGTFTKVKGTNYIEVKEFMELMDVHDNLGEPILYYKNNIDESVFAVRNNKDIYYYKITRDELDEIDTI